MRASPRPQRPTSRTRTLVKSLPGFRNGYATVNGVRLHYVVGGKGEPLVLLPGWPETWWTFHKIMPALAEHYTVIVVDLRGMGASSKPADGYDKKTMAADIHELVKSLGYDKASIAGHDIGSAVAFAYAANYPQATDRLVMIELPHPDDSLLTFPLLAAARRFGDKLGSARPYLWWFAFNQIHGLPEKLLAGRIGLEQDWIFTYFLKNKSAIAIPGDDPVLDESFHEHEPVQFTRASSAPPCRAATAPGKTPRPDGGRPGAPPGNPATAFPARRTARCAAAARPARRPAAAARAAHDRHHRHLPGGRPRWRAAVHPCPDPARPAWSRHHLVSSGSASPRRRSPRRPPPCPR